MVIGGFKSKNLSENFVMYGVNFFEHTVREDERLPGVHGYCLDYLSVDSEPPFAWQGAMLEKRGKDFTCV